MAEIKNLQVPIDQCLMLHNTYEHFSSDKDKKTRAFINKNLKYLKSSLSPRITSINKQITVTNKMLNGLDFNHQIPKINTEGILQLTDKRFQTIFKVEDAQKISNENYHILLEEILRKPVESIQDFIKIVYDETFRDDLDKLSEPYRNGIQQSLDVCSVGYYSTAVFIAGRTMEELINSFYLKLFKIKKFKRFDLSKAEFERKINQLNSQGYLNDELYHSLSNIRIDRNKFGHPSKKILSKLQAHLKIRVIVDLIPEIERKIDKIS
jgi:hypothetical protein